MAKYRKKSGKKYVVRRILVAVVLLLLIAGIVFATVKLLNSVGNPKNAASPENSGNSDTESTVSQPPHIVSTATIGSTGDILIHNPILYAARNKSSYDFTNCYEYIKPYYSKYDLGVVNLEVTFGTDGNYSGYPLFNAPPSLADTVKNAGVDLCLTANNHSNDTGANGFLNTVKVLREKGIDYIGTTDNEAQKPYGIRTVNDIKIAMACYTYSTVLGNGEKALNGNPLRQGTDKLISAFDYNNLDEFYQNAENALREMKADGAEFSIIYVHWGNEYQIKENSYQNTMAQALCDMGWDVIVGSHPHVVQPFETLTGKNGNKTVCIYSMGNSISNQRRQAMDNSIAKQGYTEDGMIFEIAIEKYSDNTVKLSNVNVLPTWVNYFQQNGKAVYRIVPLDPNVSDWTSLGVTRIQDAKESYKRTMQIVGAPLNAFRLSLGLSETPLTVK